MPFRAGPKEAAKMLAALNPQERERILKEIAGRDPHMAEMLVANMVTLEDLKFLTVKMLQEFLREIKLSDLGLALRIGSDELRKNILGKVSSSMREEIQDLLNGPPRRVSEVQEAAGKIVALMLDKVEKGTMILRNDSDEELV